MNILCVTQSSGLDVFDALARRLSPPDAPGRRAFIVSDSAYYYKKFLPKNPDFEKNAVVLKEWDITAKRNHSFDPGLLKRYEDELGGPGIFGALFADRRMVYGPLCGFTQDERRRMSDDALRSILQEALVRIDKLLEDVKPDVICGFVCVTFMEYLLALFARARGIRYINLRTARIANFFLMESTINDPSPEFLSVYRAFADGSRPVLPEAQSYIAAMRDKGLKYEGVVPASAKPPAIAASMGERLRSLAGAAYYSLVAHTPEIRNDNAVPPPFRAQVARNITVPLRALAAQKLLEKHYVRPKDLKGRYAFLPMHTEPEMQLLVYSRPYQDQVEAIRAVAMALPPDMTLVVKEHPWMIGKRHLDTYRRILSIPRVRLSAPEVDTLTYSKNADLIVTLGSSVGLDAALMGTPVVTMGGCLFNALPRHLVREVRDLSQLPGEIRDLLKNFKPDDRALECFVSAVMTHGVPVNFYSTLLGRPGVNKTSDSDFEGDSDRLAAAIADMLKRIPKNPGILPGGANW